MTLSFGYLSKTPLSGNKVLGERLDFAAIAVHAGRHRASPLNLQRIINATDLR
jgi:hypothetical protein